MIASLRGTLIARGFDDVTVECAGVGYGLSVSLRTLESLPGTNEECFVLVHTVVKEDAIDLYGFSTASEREMFRRLISVSGIGPRIALAALSANTPGDLQHALVAGDEKRLTKIPGIGRKTAQRMILELGEKMAQMRLGDEAGAAMPANEGALIDLELALLGLGYTQRDIDRVLKNIDRENAEELGMQRLLKEALTMLRS